MKPTNTEYSSVFPSDSPAPLESVLCTEELNRRPPRPPDYETENRALVALAQALADSPGAILQTLADKILEVFRSDSAGVSLLTPHDGGKSFYWPAIAGAWKPHIGGGTPRDFGPCGDVLDRNAPLLFKHFERRYTYFLPVTPRVEECLLVPFYVEGKAVGTIWAITHDDRRKFDAEDLRQLVSLGSFASSAYKAVAALDALEPGGEALRQSHAELPRRVAELQKANAQAREARRAALNLMEDAVQSRQAMETLNAKLFESEGRFRLLLETLPLGAYTCDAEGLITYFNPRAVEVWGRTPKLNDAEERFCGSFRLYTTDGAPIRHDQCWMALAIKEDKVYDGHEILIERPDGSRLTALAHINPIHDAAGKVLGAVNIVVDITERKRAEAVMAHMAAIVESSDDAIISKDLNGIITSWNKGAERLFGYTAAEVIGKPGTLLIPPDRFDEEPKILELLRRGEQVDHYETVRRRKDGNEIDISLTVSPIRDKVGKVIGASKIAFDITDRKRAEIEREELLLKESAARAEAEAANYSKDEFLAAVSHDLRSPLNSILGWNQMLRDQKSADPDVAHVTEVVERAGRAQLQLIEDLLDTARIVSGKMRLNVETIELTQVIISALETVRPAAESKGVAIIPMLDPGAGQTTGDPDRLQQVVWNLLSNAVKFTPAGGQVQIELRRGPSEARIVVRDTGQGISPDLLPYVFDRFKQGDSFAPSRLGGLGLGLAIVKHLVELHGGRVVVESPGEGMGATFTVSLPTRAATTEDEEAATSRSSINWHRFDGLRVLVVDDEEDARELVATTLALCGARVTQVESAAAALAALESRDSEGPFDVIVSDIGMPGEDGYSLLRKVRSLADESVSRVPAVALTSHARFKDRMRALQAGFQTHVAKPVETKELIAVVAGLIGRLQRTGAGRRIGNRDLQSE